MYFFFVGNSMQPVFSWFGVIKTNKPVDLKVGDIVLYGFHGRWGLFGVKLVHRIIGMDGNMLSIKGDNCRFIDVVPRSWVIAKIVKFWSVF